MQNPNKMITTPEDDFDKRRIQRWEKAADHFNKSQADHAKQQKSIANEGIEEALSSDKVEKDRLEARKTFVPSGDALGLERIIGQSDLLPINYLQRGLDVAKSVCRIHILQPTGRPDGYGTGFMISRSLLLTNNHVLSNSVSAKRSFAEFEFELDSDFLPRQSHYFQLDPDRFYYTCEELDFTIVAVRPQSRSGKALTEYGHLKLKETSGKALPTESVTIIQHPLGAAKAIALRSNRILGRKEHFIHYETDTEPGSSGSPIFSDDWEVVALHHAGVPKKDNKGRLIRQDGKIWKQGIDSPQLIQWIANEGIRISSIFENLKQQTGWTPEELTALDDLGTTSKTTLNESLQKLSPPKVVNSPDDQKRPEETAPQRISYKKLQEMLDDPDITEGTVAPYFRLDPDESRGLAPMFRINEDLVQIDQPELRESALLLNSANWICKRSRHRAYRKRIKENKNATKIISEGDSWFQYPFRLHDVIDHLMDDPDLAILSFGEAGDLIRDIVAKAEFLPALTKEDPEFFLISGWGNDIVDGEGLKRFLFKPHNSFDPHMLINRPALERFKLNLASDYNNLFRIVLGATPKIQILCHGYSYPIPNNGKWLGKPMNKLGITDSEVQTEIMRIIFDEVNETVQETAESFPQSVRFLNTRNVVPPHGWFDEFHPQNPHFGNVASVFKDEIKNINNR